MKSVIVDTNVLVLLIVGQAAPEKIGSHRRLRAFDEADFRNLSKLLSQFGKHITVPNVLTEASNLIGSGDQEIAPGCCEALGVYGCKTAETYIESKQVICSEDYLELGLADAAVISAAMRSRSEVITTDRKLFGTLESHGARTHNLFHFKTPARYE